ncbi:dTDP-4-amino-4,6-dideoxygalactose transaminase [Saccharicrinis carchari]|uniref:GDP-perosamine synthase n=1 Tax=Saccharicrinis carchari TaxID=1168039 RepID=A0A521BU16_SACCC|nr:aminotransferase class I/II-fold pyridoxal phosphate-dependent enzyme [Saccharicrinis carchari]SMO50648.1 dTDP-4-amino-4,6-dideoxygalactose transaminase [Saccharicrinis carchari]
MNTQYKRVYLSSPHMSGHEQKYIQQAFEQNWIAPLGPNVNAFEDTLAAYCGVKHAAALSSGTAALHLALIMLGLEADDEVLVSTFTFSATVNPIVYQGAKPVFIDSETDTWNMDPVLLEQALEERKASHVLHKVKAIIVVHLYGMPAKMDQIMELANRYGVPVIEDAAEALGSKYKGKPLGSFGKMSILSFNGNKIITTSGGGALLCNEEAYAIKARFLATQARDQAPHYQHSQIGYNYRMSNVLAGIGRGQMEVIDERVEKRIENFNFYKSGLAHIKALSFPELPNEQFFSNRWLSTSVIDSEQTGITYLQVQEALEQHNIETRPLWKPMHLQPIFKKYKAYLNNTSETLFATGICLPSGSNLSNDDRNRVLELIAQCFLK